MITVGLALLLWHLSAPAEHLIGRLMLVLPALMVGSGQWTERPYMFGLLALAGVLALDQSQHDVRWAVPVMWLWMQMHGSFPLGVLALLCLALGQRLDGRPWHRTLSIAKWSAVGVALGLVNPFGPKLLIFPLSLLQRNDMLHHIVEWQSPGFTSWAERAFLVQLVIVVALLARKPSWRLAVPTIVFRSDGHGQLTQLGGRQHRDDRGRGADRPGPRNHRWQAAPGHRTDHGGRDRRVCRRDRRLGREPGRRQLQRPTRLTRWDGCHNRVALQLGAAGGPGRGRQLPRGRLRGLGARLPRRSRGIFSPAVFADQITLMNGTVDWRGALDRAHPSVVVWPRPLPLTSILLESPDWRSVYADPDWVVFERR